jgi:hypothetical protein
MRTNPNPRIEKLKDYRNHGIKSWKMTHHPDCTNEFRKIAWRANRRSWRSRKWNYEWDDTLTFSTFNPRHNVLWEIW